MHHRSSPAFFYLVPMTVHVERLRMIGFGTELVGLQQLVLRDVLDEVLVLDIR